MLVKLFGAGFGLDCYFDAPDGGGGGVADPAAGTPSGAPPSGAPAEPTVYEVDENTLIKPKGANAPIKFGDHTRGFQSQFTKAAQEAARLKQALQERDQRIAQIEAAQKQAQANQGGQQDPYAQLRSLPYLSGEEAAGVVQSIGQQFQQRDAILLAALKKLQELSGVVQNLHQSSTMSSFDAKISKWLQDGGYPPEAADLAKDIYLAYEGEDLDNEFPRIFAERWAQVENLIEARRQQKVQQARRQPFVPGKGGAAGPSKPFELPGDANPRQIADLLFDSMSRTET